MVLLLNVLLVWTFSAFQTNNTKGAPIEKSLNCYLQCTFCCWPVCHVLEPLVDYSGRDLLLQGPHASDLPRQGNEHADVSGVWELKITKFAPQLICACFLWGYCLWKSLLLFRHGAKILNLNSEICVRPPTCRMSHSSSWSAATR